MLFLFIFIIYYMRKRKKNSLEVIHMTNNSLAKQIQSINHTATGFQSSIVVKFDDKNIDVKSILGLFTSLTTTKSYHLEVRGVDATEAAAAVKAAFEAAGLKVDAVVVEVV